MEKSEEFVTELTYEDREQLTQDILDRVPTKKIYEKYNIKDKQVAKRILMKYTVPVDSYRTCPYCEVKLKYNLEENLMSYRGMEYCIQCGHREENRSKWISNGYKCTEFVCSCPGCEGKKQSKIQKINLIKNPNSKRRISIDSISDVSKVYLLFVLFGENNFESIHWKKLSGYSFFDDSVLEELLNQGALRIKPEESINAFDDTITVMDLGEEDLVLELNLKEDLDVQKISSNIILSEFDRIELWQDLVILSLRNHIDTLLKKVFFRCYNLDYLNDLLFEMMGRLSEAQIKTILYDTLI